MVSIVAIHSYSGGTGRTTLATNLASILALQGKRIGVLDASLQAPGMMIAYELERHQIFYTFNDYLRGNCQAKDIAYEINTISASSDIGIGKVYVIPASIRSEEIASILTEGYDVDLFKESFYALDKALDLDFLLIDVQAGVNEEILNIIVTLDHLILLLCTNPQDYVGTQILADLAKDLEVLEITLVVNKVLPEEDIDVLKKDIEFQSQYPVKHVLPFSLDMARTGNKSFFAMKNPNDPLTLSLQRVAQQIS